MKAERIVEIIEGVTKGEFCQIQPHAELIHGYARQLAKYLVDHNWEIVDGGYKMRRFKKVYTPEEMVGIFTEAINQ